MQLWRVGPCSSFWVEYGNIHSKYSQRGWKGTHFALYALHHAVSFMYFHSKHTQEQNRKKTEKQCNWINYLPTWKHKSFTTKDYRSGDLCSTELLILKQMSAAALRELKDWNIKRKKKKKNKTRHAFMLFWMHKIQSYSYYLRLMRSDRQMQDLAAEHKRDQKLCISFAWNSHPV